LAFGAAALVHVAAIRAEHMTAVGAFNLVGILQMISTSDSSVAKASLSIWVDISYHYSFTPTTSPFHRPTFTIHSHHLSYYVT
jgi:hypothetical protein